MSEEKPKGGHRSLALRTALERPPLAPHPMYKQVCSHTSHRTWGASYCPAHTLTWPRGIAAPTSSCSAQIVAGVLIKYVNFGKGWRHRLFVLQNGVLRYYKVRSNLAGALIARAPVHVLTVLEHTCCTPGIW